MRYSLRTLLILMAVVPPVLALAWWYWRLALSAFLLAAFFCRDLLFGLFVYAFGALCHLIERLPEPGRRKDSN